MFFFLPPAHSKTLVFSPPIRSAREPKKHRSDMKSHPHLNTMLDSKARMVKFCVALAICSFAKTAISTGRQPNIAHWQTPAQERLPGASEVLSGRNAPRPGFLVPVWATIDDSSWSTISMANTTPLAATVPDRFNFTSDEITGQAGPCSPIFARV